MSDELKQTPFSASYPDGVVEWIDVYGYAVPLTWGDPGAEYAAARNHAAAFEFSMLFLSLGVQALGLVGAPAQFFQKEIWSAGGNP